MAATTKDEILDAIAGMTVLELSELLKEFEEKFGVTAAAPVAAAAPGAAAGGGGGEAAEEQDAFDVILTAAGDKKIQVIKEVRSLTSLGLKEAKELVEALPAGGADREHLKRALGFDRRDIVLAEQVHLGEDDAFLDVGNALLALDLTPLGMPRHRADSIGVDGADA